MWQQILGGWTAWPLDCSRRSSFCSKLDLISNQSTWHSNQSEGFVHQIGDNHRFKRIVPETNALVWSDISIRIHQYYAKRRFYQQRWPHAFHQQKDRCIYTIEATTCLWCSDYHRRIGRHWWLFRDVTTTNNPQLLLQNRSLLVASIVASCQALIGLGWSRN